MVDCPHCGRELTTPAPTRRLEPHRGPLILTLGILGLFCWPAATTAWVLGAADLQAMANGRMDKSGRSQTQASVTLAVAAFIVGAAALVLLFVEWAWLMQALRRF